MDIGLWTSHSGGGGLSQAIKEAEDARAAGFKTYWVPQIFGLDALTAIAVIGSQVPDIEFGTSVIPTYPRHPMMLAAQALTTTEALGSRDRLILGIGLSHEIVVEHMWGLSYAKPFTHMSEYLDALLPLVAGEAAQVHGSEITAAGQLDFSDVETPTVMVAALGPKMLKLTGERTGGTITWMTGPKTLANHVVPSITAAASDAGRAAPRVCAGLPICVTDDIDGARAKAAAEFAVYGTLPSYQAMLDREGVSGPEGVAVVGNEDSVREQLDVLDQAGVTDLAAVPIGSGDEVARTREFLRSLL